VPKTARKTDGAQNFNARVSCSCAALTSFQWPLRQRARLAECGQKAVTSPLQVVRPVCEERTEGHRFRHIERVDVVREWDCGAVVRILEAGKQDSGVGWLVQSEMEGRLTNLYAR
jgi:hypothetical protein